MTPGFAKPRAELPWLPYGDVSRVIINAHNFGGTWTPADTTEALWLDAGDSSTLFDAVSGGSLVAADGAVARWQDKSGNARHVTQATSGNRPLRKTSIQNSRDVLRLDATDFLQNTSAALVRNVTGWSVFAVAVSTSATAERAVVQVITSAGNSRAYLAKAATTGIILTGGRRRSTDSFAAISGGSAVSAPALFGSVANFTTTTITAFVDGAQVSQNTSWLTSGVSDNDAGGLTVGANTLGALNWSGDICEIIVVESAVSQSLREQFEGYLAHRWGLQASLPGAHPYRSVAP